MSAVEHICRSLEANRARGLTVEELADLTGYTPQLIGDALMVLRRERRAKPTVLTRPAGLLPDSAIWIPA
jgi:hypothetical protein